MNKIFKNLVWKFSERISAQIVTFIVSIILARLLSPNDYGNIALVTIFISIAEVFVVSGFGNALIQKLDANNIDFSSVFYVNFVLSIIIYLILFFLSPTIANFYSEESLISVIRVLGLRIPIASINSIQQAYVSKYMIFKKFFFSTLIGTLISGILGIIMAFYGLGIWALVFQYLINTAVNTLVLWFTLDWRPELVFSFSRVKQFISFGWKLLVSGLIDTGYNQLRGLLIGKLYSSADLAYYNRGQQYPQLIVTNINASISSVLFPSISLYQNDLESVKQITRKAIKISSYIMWPMMIGLGIVAKPMISIMLTDKWLPCVPYLQIACFTYAFWPIHTANLEALKAIGRTDIYLILEIIKKIVGILLLLVTVSHGVMAIALSLIVSTIISSMINAYPNSKILGYSYFDQIKDIAPSVMLSLFMALAIYPISIIINNSLLLIIIQVLLGIIIYVFFSRIFHIEAFMYIIRMIANIKK